PTVIRTLGITKRNLDYPDFFVNRLNRFIQDNELELTHNFLKQYDPSFASTVFSEIQNDLNSGSFYDSILRVFRRVQLELNNLDDKIKEINEQKRSLRLAK